MAANGVSEATELIEIKIKTLDSQTHNLRVDKCVPVLLLKDKIADLTGIESNQQRLICRGKILGDNENLSNYHVEDGHTLHLVVKQPPESSRNPDNQNMSNMSDNTQNTTRNEGIVLEAINIEPRSRGFPNIGQIISSIIGSFGGPQSLRTEAGGSNDESGPSDPNPSSFRVEIGSMQAPSQTPIAPSLNPTPIPDSLTTISQYLDFMNQEFIRAGFGSSNYRAFGHGNGVQSVSNLSQAAQSTRLLMAQARACLLGLAEQLSDNANMREESSRQQLQALSMRSGVLMQNLGSLLLELGRTAMMFHAGPTPQDASVNAGPAVFISGNGPNPLMVQPVPFFPGSSSIGGHTHTHTGGLHFGQTGGVHLGQTGGAHLGQAYTVDPVRPRSIDIHIRTGRFVPAGTEQEEDERDAANRNPTSPVEATNGEQGARGFPIRMVAVPVLARVHHAPPPGRSQDNNISNGGGGGGAHSQSQTERGPLDVPQEQYEDFTTLLNDLLGRAINGENLHSPPISPLIPPADSAQVGPTSSQQTREQAVQFSNLLRQVLPAVSEILDIDSPPPSANMTRSASDQAMDYRDINSVVDPFAFDMNSPPPPRGTVRLRRREQAGNLNGSNNPGDSSEAPSFKRPRNNE